MPVLPGAFLIRLRMKPSVQPVFLRHYINSPVMNKMTMKMFDEMCLTPTEELTTERIQQIRSPEKRTSVWKV